jgi:hypothetical protein
MARTIEHRRTEAVNLEQVRLQETQEGKKAWKKWVRDFVPDPHRAG